jgi:hypothetical protein
MWRFGCMSGRLLERALSKPQLVDEVEAAIRREIPANELEE